MVDIADTTECSVQQLWIISTMLLFVFRCYWGVWVSISGKVNSLW